MRHGSNYRESNRRKWLVAALIGVMLALAFFVGRGTAPEQDESVRVPAGGGTPENQTQQTEEGAVEAATSFARIMAAPSGDTAAYLDTAEEIAAPGWEDRARELAQGALDFVNGRYGEDASVAFHPIRYRVRSWSSEEAAIDIWGVVLASGPKVGGVEESWVTATLNLRWVESGWKVEGQSSQGGPTPELLRTEDQVPLDEVLEDFQEYGE